MEAPDWLGACRRITAELGEMFAGYASTGERAVVVGQGEGGDRTLAIDAAAEALIFAELERLHGAGHEFLVISEERGEVAYGAGPLRVVVDPVDGSLNAKRGLWPYTVSIAVADGPAMADVLFGFVYDFGLREEWSALRGAGARLRGEPLLAEGERRTRRGLLEIVAVEGLRAGFELGEFAHRVRSFGSIAFSLCQLAAGRADGLMTLRAARSVDAAAGQLIVREAGGLVAFTAAAEPLAQPLELAARSPLVGALSEAGLAELVAAEARIGALRSSGG
jgi:myo-inositol-1(or 4)-monophosphatase